MVLCVLAMPLIFLVGNAPRAPQGGKQEPAHVALD
jgi:hypothetical protein